MPANSPPVPARKPLKRSTVWILASVIALLTLNWVAAIARFQVNVPIWDQWDFFNPLFDSEGSLALFNYQHGPHRQGVGFIFSSWIMAASHWDSRIESLWMVALLATTAILSLGLKKRLTGRLQLSDACITVLILTLAQWGSVISVPNASHSVFPLLLIILSAHCWIASKPAIRLPVSGALALFSIFTGFGMFNGLALSALLMGAWVRALLNRRKAELGWASLGLTMTALGWIFFLRGYQFNPASDGYRFPYTPVFDYVRFLALMVSHPAGGDQPNTLAQLAGGVLLASCLGVFTTTAFRSFRNDIHSQSNEIIALLLGSGLTFAAFTAVGRIHLGISAGMASRYVTLLIPLWLGLYFWGAFQTRPALRYGSTLMAVLVALLPLTPLLCRPVATWPGTAGLTNAALSQLADSTDQKMAWVSAYLCSSNFSEADRVTGRLIHPAGENISLDRKLTWLKNRNLSFFKSAASSNAWQPWWSENRSTWLHTHDPESGKRWMADACMLWLNAEHEGFVNFQVVQAAPTLPANTQLEITHRQITTSEPLEFLREIISMPITKGEQMLTLRSTTGSVPAHPPDDNRLISYRLTDPWITREPAGVAWITFTSEKGLFDWAPRYRWRVVSGFYGWEHPAAFGWSNDCLEIEILSETPVYLNAQIEKRYHPVASGPVIIHMPNRSIEISDPNGRLAFSLFIPASSEPIIVKIENPAGAASPKASEGKADTRSLAFKFTHLGVLSAPKYPMLSGNPPTHATGKKAPAPFLP